MNAPKSATHYLPAPNGSPQLWYRVGTVKLNTGETRPTLEYFGHCDSWQGTNANSHAEQLSKLVLIDSPKVREKRSKAYRAGKYRFNPPPVYHGNWSEESWCNYVRFDDPALNGFLPYTDTPSNKGGK